MAWHRMRSAQDRIVLGSQLHLIFYFRCRMGHGLDLIRKQLCQHAHDLWQIRADGCHQPVDIGRARRCDDTLVRQMRAQRVHQLRTLTD